MVLSFRDLGVELKGDDRIIPLRSDDTRIFTCFLEYEDDYVTVSDLVYERKGEAWEFHRSSYRKVRLTSVHIHDLFLKVGFEIGRRKSKTAFSPSSDTNRSEHSPMDALHTFRLGDFELTIISEGNVYGDPTIVFEGVDESIWRPLTTLDEQGRIVFGLNIILVRADDRLVLLDTGIGEPSEARERFESMFPFSAASAASRCLRQTRTFT